MTPESNAFIRYRLELAQETWEDAILLKANQRYRSAVNRLYYACFYCVSALLLVEGRSSSKHSGIFSLFTRHWIKPGRMEKRLGKLYHQLFLYRHRGDYELTTFEPEQIAVWCSEVQEFLEVVSAQVQENLKPPGDTA